MLLVGKTNYRCGVALQMVQFLLQFALRNEAIGLQDAGKPLTAMHNRYFVVWSSHTFFLVLCFLSTP